MKISIFYFIRISFAQIFGSIFYSKIDEKKVNISKLTKNVLKDTLSKEKYPIILINPFSKDNNIMNSLLIGYIDKWNILFRKKKNFVNIPKKIYLFDFYIIIRIISSIKEI